MWAFDRLYPISTRDDLRAIAGSNGSEDVIVSLERVSVLDLAASDNPLSGHLCFLRAV